jgi:hypothetical protein
MKRFSERFFNPRPAPDPAEAEQHEQYGIAYSDGIEHEQRPPQLQLDGLNEGTLNNSSGHGHAAVPMQNEVMAAGSAEPKEKQRQEYAYANEKHPESPQQRPLSLANGLSRNRLPTLAEVLARRTLPPVDLYCFYLFMQREGSEDALDFWLDVQQHENLCRAYFKDLRRSGGNLQEDWPGYYREARERGSIYSPVTGIEQDPDAWRSRGEKQAGYREGDHGRAETESMMGGYGRASDGEWHLPEAGQPRFPGDPDYAMPRQSSSERAERKNNLFKRSSMAPTVFPRQTAISRADLVASAERIYARYLLPGSEKEIYLPPQLRITSFPLSSSAEPDLEDEAQQAALARVPDMFHPQKEYVFRTMEADVFPRFLRSKAFGNLTPVSALVRLTLGLLALWAGFATAFSFIFLDVNRQKRLWVILPFTVAVLLIVSHQYELDPILALAQQSETTPFHLITVREKYVRKLLLQRAFGVFFLIVLITAALTVLFVFVPGHRL